MLDRHAQFVPVPIRCLSNEPTNTAEPRTLCLVRYAVLFPWDQSMCIARQDTSSHFSALFRRDGLLRFVIVSSLFLLTDLGIQCAYHLHISQVKAYTNVCRIVCSHLTPIWIIAQALELLSSSFRGTVRDEWRSDSILCRHASLDILTLLRKDTCARCAADPDHISSFLFL